MRPRRGGSQDALKRIWYPPSNSERRGVSKGHSNRKGDEAQRERHSQPRQPLCQNREERNLRPVRIGLPAGEERTSQSTEVLPRTEEIVMLIGTAVCGKPHVRWCERAGEIKPSPLYSILQKRWLCLSSRQIFRFVLFKGDELENNTSVLDELGGIAPSPCKESLGR